MVLAGVDYAAGRVGYSESPPGARWREIAVDIDHQVGVVAGRAVISPSLPAGTMAALATMVPVRLLSVDTGCCGSGPSATPPDNPTDTHWVWHG